VEAAEGVQLILRATSHLGYQNQQACSTDSAAAAAAAAAVAAGNAGGVDCCCCWGCVAERAHLRDCFPPEEVHQQSGRWEVAARQHAGALQSQGGEKRAFGGWAEEHHGHCYLYATSLGAVNLAACHGYQGCQPAVGRVVPAAPAALAAVCP